MMWEVRHALETCPLDQSFAREVVGLRLWRRKTIRPLMTFALNGHITRGWSFDAKPLSECRC